MRQRVYLSLGSNTGDRTGNMLAAIERLSQIGEVVAVSSFYETEPVEFTTQPWFLNCVASLETAKSPAQVLQGALAIEQGMGRRRTQAKGPRNIDIDVLLYGDRIVDEKGLHIPHPGLAGRRFVLEPLVEIAPDVLHPALKKTALELRDALPPGQVVRKLEQGKGTRG
jgi:2-amino-4-hydroxy-6-hydroxymethyldihydropteridine diphosphokinase